MKKQAPSMDQWLQEAKADDDAPKVGMYLTHNGVVRQTARAKVRSGKQNAENVVAMEFSHDPAHLRQVIEDIRRREGIYYVRVWLNEGRLNVGDDLMYVLVGGDIRPHVVEALQELVGRIKTECVTEREIY